MGISDYLKDLRRHVGNDLLLLPSVTVLLWDDRGRLMLMREAETMRWQTIGGTVDPDESPWDAARREALEEAGTIVRLERLRAAVGGPGYRVHYPNGDLCSYVASVFDAVVETGVPTPDGTEAHELRWFEVHEIAELDLDPLNRRLLHDVGVLDASGG
jgi:8-oxo-dGTP pyrophosphatase MutT (NUDIX family)